MDNLREAYKTSTKNLVDAFDQSIDGINKAYDDAVKELQLKEHILHEREQIHNDEIHRFEQEKAKIASVMTFDPIVDLNVGGVHYSTSLDTLQKFKGSMLEAMFSGRYKLNTDKKGRVFIDRDGHLFKYIINYLRGYELSIPADDESLVAQEMIFYGLPWKIEEKKTVPVWTLDVSEKGGNLQLSTDCMSVTKVSKDSSHGDSSVLGTMGFSTGVHVWKVTINGLKDNMWICIGVIKKPKSDRIYDDVHGWTTVGSRLLLKTSENSSFNLKGGGEIILKMDCGTDTLSAKFGGNTESILNVTARPIFPYFNLYKIGNSVEIQVLSEKDW